MRKIWARIGMYVEVTEEEYVKLKKEAEYTPGHFDDIDPPEWLVDRYRKEGEIEGDSYIPALVFELLEDGEEAVL